jgi:hypothetical protein
LSRLRKEGHGAKRRLIPRTRHGNRHPPQSSGALPQEGREDTASVAG